MFYIFGCSPFWGNSALQRKGEIHASRECASIYILNAAPSNFAKKRDDLLVHTDWVQWANCDFYLLVAFLALFYHAY
jgi:hypothetical protein